MQLFSLWCFSIKDTLSSNQNNAVSSSNRQQCGTKWQTKTRIGQQKKNKTPSNYSPLIALIVGRTVTELKGSKSTLSRWTWLPVNSYHNCSIPWKIKTDVPLSLSHQTPHCRFTGQADFSWTIKDTSVNLLEPWLGHEVNNFISAHSFVSTSQRSFLRPVKLWLLSGYTNFELSYRDGLQAENIENSLLLIFS